MQNDEWKPALKRAPFVSSFFILHNPFLVSRGSADIGFPGASLPADAVTGENISVWAAGAVSFHAELFRIWAESVADPRGRYRFVACGKTYLPVSSLGRV